MKSLERRFNNIVKKNPLWSSYICFIEAVRGSGFSKQAVSRWFNKLVSKDDYAKADKRGILTDLVTLSNTREDNQKSGKTAT